MLILHISHIRPQAVLMSPDPSRRHDVGGGLSTRTVR